MKPKSYILCKLMTLLSIFKNVSTKKVHYSDTKSLFDRSIMTESLFTKILIFLKNGNYLPLDAIDFIENEIFTNTKYLERDNFHLFDYIPEDYDPNKELDLGIFQLNEHENLNNQEKHDKYEIDGFKRHDNHNFQNQNEKVNENLNNQERHENKIENTNKSQNSNNLTNFDNSQQESIDQTQDDSYDKSQNSKNLTNIDNSQQERIDQNQLRSFHNSLNKNNQASFNSLKFIYKNLNSKWLHLSKLVPDTFTKDSTLISFGIPYFVPGGRFNEFYYWDSYWTLKGLLKMNMHKSAKNLVQNFILMIRKYGFILNGSRLYYMGRTQPPFFTQMIYELYRHDPTRYKSFVLGEALDAAIVEYDWLIKNRSVTVEKNGKGYKLARYFDSSEIPRLESFREDCLIAQELLEASGNEIKKPFADDRKACGSSLDMKCQDNDKVSKGITNDKESTLNLESNRHDGKIIFPDNTNDKESTLNLESNRKDGKTPITNDKGVLDPTHRSDTNRVYNEKPFKDIINDKEPTHLSDTNGKNIRKLFIDIRSAAESGWDFSSRWLKDSKNLRTIHTSDFIPADLNGILFKNEKIISELLEIRGDKELSRKFKGRSRNREKAMEIFLWNSDQGIWNDYDFVNGKLNDRVFYFSNIVPMLMGIDPPGKTYEEILLKNKGVLFGYAGGVPASEKSEIPHSHQWDFPNVWAPHQSMLVDFLEEKGFVELAIHTARSFYENVKIGFEKHKVFFEKYDCERLGHSGQGGEYVPQEGFGWTNGVAIDFIHKFGKSFLEKFEHSESFEVVSKILENLILEGKKGIKEGEFGVSNRVDVLNKVDVMNNVDRLHRVDVLNNVDRLHRVDVSGKDGDALNENSVVSKEFPYELNEQLHVSNDQKEFIANPLVNLNVPN